VSVHFATPLRIGCDMFAFSLLPTSGAVSPAGMAALASASAMDMVSRGIRGSNNTVNSDEQRSLARRRPSFRAAFVSPLPRIVLQGQLYYMGYETSLALGASRSESRAVPRAHETVEQIQL